MTVRQLGELMGQGQNERAIVGGAWDSPAAPDPIDAPVLEPPAKAHVGPNDWEILVNAPVRADVPTPANNPYSGIVLIEFFFQKDLIRLGTGFFIEPNIFITARHVLEPNNFDQSGFWRGYDTHHNPAGPSLTVLSNARHPNLDLAVLRTKENSPFSFQMVSPAAPPGPAQIAGYAMPYDNGNARLSWATGPVTFGPNNIIGYHISTRPGDSGAPVFGSMGGSTEALGVHTEAPVGTPNMNAGIRYTPSDVAEVNKLVAFAKAH